MTYSFTDAQCGDATDLPSYDLQLASDFMNNLANQTFNYSCYANPNEANNIFTQCYDSELTFCIGKHNQQHACTINQCHIVDWTFQAAPCATKVMNYTSLQPAGLAVPCCDSSFCTGATVNSSNSAFGCSTGTTMYLCVVADTSLECINPSNTSDICSGNFTASLSSNPADSTGGGNPGTGGSSKVPKTEIIIPSVIGALFILALLSYFTRRRNTSTYLVGLTTLLADLSHIAVPVVTPVVARPTYLVTRGPDVYA